MKTIRVRDKFYNKVKDIAERKKITIGEAVEMVASHKPGDSNHVSYSDHDPELNHANHTNHDNRNHMNHNNSDFVTREEFDRTVQEIWHRVCDWTKELLENLKEAGIDLLDDANEAEEEN